MVHHNYYYNTVPTATAPLTEVNVFCTDKTEKGWVNKSSDIRYCKIRCEIILSDNWSKDNHNDYFDGFFSQMTGLISAMGF